MIIDIFNNFQNYLTNNNITYPVTYLTELESINALNNNIIITNYIIWIIMILIFISLTFNLFKTMVYAIKSVIY